MRLLRIGLIPLFFLSSCSRYYLSVEKEKMDLNHLSSVAVGTPDPRQNHPPVGERLIVEWYVPSAVMKKNPHIHLTLLYWNFEEESVTLPIKHRLGNTTFDLLDQKYLQNKGILAYKAEIVEEDGTIYRTWKHQLWVKIIRSEGGCLPTNDELFRPSFSSDEPEFDSSW